MKRFSVPHHRSLPEATLCSLPSAQGSPCSIIILILVRCVLLVLIFSYQISDVLVRLLKLHLVHALALVPVKEGFPPVHRTELRCEPLENTLGCCCIGYHRARLGFIS